MNAIMLQGLLFQMYVRNASGSFAIISMGLQNLYAIKLIITIAMISSAVARIFLLIDTSCLIFCAIANFNLKTLPLQHIRGSPYTACVYQLPAYFQLSLFQISLCTVYQSEFTNVFPLFVCISISTLSATNCGPVFPSSVISFPVNGFTGLLISPSVARYGVSALVMNSSEVVNPVLLKSFTIRTGAKASASVSTSRSSSESSSNSPLAWP